MLDKVMQWFVPGAAEQVEAIDPAERVQIATCALLVEMAQSDSEFSDLERDHIVEVMTEHFGLSRDKAKDVLDAAEEEVLDSVHLWRFTSLINQHFSIDEKLAVMERVWELVYIDGKLDRYEDHLVHRLANLLNFTHKQLIDAKLKVLQKKLPILRSNSE